MRDAETTFEDRFEGVGERAVADVVKESGYGENPRVVPGQASVPGIEERQSRYANAVVVSVMPVAGLDAVERSQKADPPQPLDGAGSGQLPKKRIPERAPCAHRSSRWGKGRHVRKQRQTTPANRVDGQPRTHHVVTPFLLYHMHRSPLKAGRTRYVWRLRAARRRHKSLILATEWLRGTVRRPRSGPGSSTICLP